ncbi:MAG TPA: endonuclease domain-containing protein [Allosphingosinicella sp.]
MRGVTHRPPRPLPGRGTAADGGGGGGSSTESFTTLQRARQLRRAMSPPEVKLWQELRSRPGGFSFRRRRPADPYILDFFCRSAGLAIEVDGDAHDMGGNPIRDIHRDAELARRGIKTLRFPAAEVMRNLEGVLAQIVEECASRTPSTTLRVVPLPAEARGGR